MTYTIGEMAKIFHIAPSTLRYYDEIGILPTVKRTKGGIRIFDDKDYEWLNVIDCLKKSGLSINDISRFAEMVKQGDRSLLDRLTLFEERKKALQEQIADLNQTLRLVEYKCWYYQTAIEENSESHLKDIPIDDIPVQYRDIVKKIRSSNRSDQDLPSGAAEIKDHSE